MLLKDMDVVRSGTGSNAENIQLLRLLLRAFKIILTHKKLS